MSLLKENDVQQVCNNQIIEQGQSKENVEKIPQDRYLENTKVKNDILNLKEEKLKTKEQELSTKEIKLKIKEEELSTKEQELEKYKNSIDKAKNEFERLKQGRENCFAKERNDFDKEMLDKKNALDKELTQTKTEKLLEISNEVSEYRKKEFEKIQQYINEEKERVKKMVEEERTAWEVQKQQEKTSATKIISEERTAWKTQKEQERTELDRYKGEIINNINSEKQALEQQKQAWEQVKEDLYQRDKNLKQLQEELNKNKGALLALREQYETDRAMFEQGKLLKEQQIRNNIEEGIRSFREDLENKIQRKDKEIDGLLATNREIELTVDCKKYYNFFKEQDLKPTNILETISSLKSELQQTKQEKLDLETKYNDYDTIKERVSSLDREKKGLEQKLTQQKEKIDSIVITKQEKDEYKRKSEKLEADLKIQEGKYSLLQTNFDDIIRKYGTEKKQDSSARINSINNKIVEVTYIEENQNDINEIDWINGIYKKCKDIGFDFNNRLLKAFHTSLKVSDWSQLTVLAGVSGTGKSELPRLYSHFGGLYFMPVPVQPNWDSQESMLGFYNSIDNRFDAQDVLRFLAQSQREKKDNDGLKDYVCLVLLDEMNLAHPELYFAEFLSKLEMRRGLKRNQVPKLEVNIGSDVEKYKIDLGRNVLWTGTMNQDETTKSLSDKVVDRSMIINFPRPKDLVSRKLSAIDDNNRGKILKYITWHNFISRDLPFTDDEIKPYNKFMTQINEYLGKIGRAIGHRVWQATEYYMANYPEVIASKNEVEKLNAMNIAFEDQLVQKVMPKLRGIDTSGESREVLDDIQRLLEKGIEYSNEFKETISKNYKIDFDTEIKTKFNLQADFEQALKLGYGYFVWQTAEYLK